MRQTEPGGDFHEELKTELVEAARSDRVTYFSSLGAFNEAKIVPILAINDGFRKALEQSEVLGGLNCPAWMPSGGIKVASTVALSGGGALVLAGLALVSFGLRGSAPR